MKTAQIRAMILANKVFGYGHGEPTEEDRQKVIAVIAKARSQA